MSCILYYSNYCDPSKKLLQTIIKTENSNDMHFICIDKRVKDASGKVYIVLKNGQKIIMPENVLRVPALLLLNQNYKVIYGDEIYAHLRPQTQMQIKQATKNNMEPITFQDGFDAFSGFGCGSSIMSDNYSFLDQSETDLSVRGEGGLRQMHNYVSLNESTNYSIKVPVDDNGYGNRLKEGDVSMESLQRKRDEELSNIKYR
jgi:hypothetical protein